MNLYDMHSAGLELTKLTYPRLEDSLIRQRGPAGCHVGAGRLTLFRYFLSTWYMLIFDVVWSNYHQQNHEKGG